MLHLVPDIYRAPAPDTAPDCYKCGKPSILRITRISNRKGNARRPYYKCQSCDKFLVFKDERGNDPRNPPCHCRVSSKMQIAGREKRVSRGLHYVCRLGQCDFYDTARDSSEIQLAIDEEWIVDMFIRSCVI